jgi:hypothetical protein
MRMELCCCEQVILGEIASRAMKRRDIAQTYALAMRSREQVDWAKVNGAIIERWSMAGLQWIKEQAHSGRCFEAKEA